MGGARGMKKLGGRSVPVNVMMYSRRPIPKRGQVKVGIVVGLANSVASIFSRGTRPGISPRGCSPPSH